MKNKEKYRDEINKIELYSCMGIAKVDGKLVDCSGFDCDYCDFDDKSEKHFCVVEIQEWLEEESEDNVDMKDFKVNCVDDKGGGFTFGKIYEVKNGRITYDNGIKSGVKFKNVDELNETYDSKFELVKESKMSKFKVGDRVRIRSDRGENWNIFGEMDIYCGTIQEISKVGCLTGYRLKNCENWCFDEEDLTLVEEKKNNMFKREDLESGMLVEVENDGNKSFCLVIESDSGICISGEKEWFSIDSFNENLNYDNTKIVSVFSKTQPIYAHMLDTSGRKLLWERNEIKEVTMQEVEEKFGCKVKIVE